MTRLLERLAIVVISLALSIGVIAVLSGGLLAGRDDPGVSGQGVGPGTEFRDQGDVHLRPGLLRPVYDSNPPTSGAHIPVPITRDASVLSDDQLLRALEVGNVVFMYGTAAPPGGLSALAAAVASPFTPALAASGQAVILARQPGIGGVIGLAWRHMLRVGAAGDPLLRSFASFWLGRGAPNG
jgi:hypothetical protein